MSKVKVACGCGANFSSLRISVCVFPWWTGAGLFISYTDFTEAAIAQCRDAIVQGRVIILSTLEEIVSLLNQEGDMKAWLKAKLEAAIVDKQPFVRRLN
jgi:restriction system protein